MAMKGSDEELPLSIVEENAQGIGSSFFSGETLGITMSSFPKRKLKIARCHHKRHRIFNMSEKDFISIFNTTRNDPPSLPPLVYIINSK